MPSNKLSSNLPGPSILTLEVLRVQKSGQFTHNYSLLVNTLIGQKFYENSGFYGKSWHQVREDLEKYFNE